MTIANADTKEAVLTHNFIERGDLFILDVGETKEVFSPGNRIYVEFLEIDYDPDAVSDVRIDDIILSNENPDPGEEISIDIPLTNIGTGVAEFVSVYVNYGDEEEGSGHEGPHIIQEILPGDSYVVEVNHMYQNEGEYTIMIVVRSPNDIQMGNNVECKNIRVGDPQGSGGGCGALGPNDIPKDAHIFYTEYQHGDVVDQQDLWLRVDDIGQEIEVIKLNEYESKVLLSIPK